MELGGFPIHTSRFFIHIFLKFVPPHACQGPQKARVTDTKEENSNERNSQESSRSRKEVQASGGRFDFGASGSRTSARVCELGFTSLFSYCVEALGLSESVAGNFITVARKAREVPVLQSAIESGALSVSKARKITPVLTVANQREWIEKAKLLPTRKLEEEVARVAPKEATPEGIKFISEDRVELRLGLSKVAQEKLKRVQDLESQRTARPVSIEEALEAMLDVYLESKDPVKRAERMMKRKMKTIENNAPACVTGHVDRHESRNRDPIPVVVRHQANLRDEGQCAHLNEQGKRCENRRWIDLHHIRPRSLGGTNTLENLITVCSAHHRMEHGP